MTDPDTSRYREQAIRDVAALYETRAAVVGIAMQVDKGMLYTVEQRALVLAWSELAEGYRLERNIMQEQLIEAKARIITQLRQYSERGFLGDVDDPIYIEALRIENIGFEAAHALQKCGHSRGDYRDPQYGTPEYAGNERCIGCDSVAEAKAEVERLKQGDVR